MAQLNSISASDFRTFLEQELSRRSSVNPNYSLRAFARDLGVDSSFLSKLLNGKRSMTARTILSLAPRLSLSEQEVQDYIQKANGRRRRYSSGAQEVHAIAEIENAHLLQSMEWYHLAILELVASKNFQANAAWIAERLNLTIAQAQTALDDLMTAGALSQREDGVWKTEINNHSVSSKTNPRAQLVKQQIYNQAIALIPNHVGEHSTTTVCVSESRLAEANERIARFRRELSHFLSEPDDKQHVYQLAISLFPVSK
ncbi:TIGR02147 family protein [Bdellovibrio sp. HCB337]|uniref:TIGR02147 family protein n=1 Tax=Bdellovibrio sp. HCB337 TaxID=3394358 RepID=UPI0039A70320